MIAGIVNNREEARSQYDVERILARRLREATKSERASLYGATYDELYRRFPHLGGAAAGELSEARRLQVTTELLFLAPFLASNHAVAEFGAGDGALSAMLADRVARVWAIDASPRWLEGLETNDTLELLASSGPVREIADRSIDVIYSCHFIEHLHPEDLEDHLRDARRMLKPRGLYVCVTPNRILGPHDVSKHFSRVARGLHLQEYSHNSLRRTMRAHGFSDVQVLRRPGKPPKAFDTAAYLLAERLASLLPRPLRHRLLSSRRLFGRRPPFRPFEQVKLVATR